MRHIEDGTVNNIALVPASLIPLREQWQELANSLPPGSILICLPTCHKLREGEWNEVVHSLQSLGHRVLVVRVDCFWSPPTAET